MNLISLGLIVLNGLLSIPVVVLLFEVVAALKITDENAFRRFKLKTSKRIAVVIPAHDESSGIIPTIGDITPQLNPGDRLIVVADNCTDDTALVAEAAGAEVITRNDLGRIGKGYALALGISHLSLDPPDFVVFFDADCRIQSDALGRLSEVCNSLQRPVQACFLMKSPDNSPINHSFAEFAFLFRNWVRPLGLNNLNCPVQLMGTGMIFPWGVIRDAPLANGHLVEDLKLGLDLAAIGKAPSFHPFVKVTSDFPLTTKGTDSQRQRWVQGHLGMTLKSAPALLLRSIVGRNFNLMVLTLDLLVPPLSLLGVLVVALFLLTSVTIFVGGSVVSLLIATTNLVLFAATIVLAWVRFGRGVLPCLKLLSIGPLISKRIRLYAKMLRGRRVSQWVRTDRGDR